MTNRRRSGKGRTSVSKKSESPDKSAKKVGRRTRRGRKSESPERPENAGSECSGEEVEDSHNKGLDGDEGSDNCKEAADAGKNVDDQKAQVKEEESGGSDGSWKVKSENGGGGGIPKLKLCLTRPPEMPSPTSTTEQNPSPRRRRRSGRGNATPTKEDLVEENTFEESSKRVTRNQRMKELQMEMSTEKQAEPEEKEDPKVFSSTNNAYNAEEDETRLAVESICGAQINDDNHMSVIEAVQEGITAKEGNRTEAVDKVMQVSVEQKFEAPVEEIPIPTEKQSEQVIEESKVVQEPHSRSPSQEKKQVGESKQKVEVKVQEVEVKRQEEEVKKQEEEVKKQEEDVKNQEEGVKKQEEEVKKQEEEVKKQKMEVKKQELETKKQELEVKKQETEEQTPAKTESLPPPEPESDSVLEIMERRRSSSRDSSEERAKEAALRSRNKNKKKEGSEEGEVIESPGVEIIHQLESQQKSRASVMPAPSEKENKENFEEPRPAKTGPRKRRWGSSTSRTNKKPSVSISTDFLKEIIPEAKPLLMSEVQLSPNEEDEEGQLKDSEESLPLATKKAEREKIMQSDESEKDYEEEAAESGMEEPSHMEVTTKPTVQVKEKEFTTFTRKVSVMSSNDKLQKSPSPPRNKPSNILYIVNLVRPFTIPQLTDLLARTGTIDLIWIDKIKSKCYVKYETEEQAKTTRHALHGVRWPVSNPKQLSVDFGTEAAMKAAMEGNEITTKRPIPSLFDKQIEWKTSEKMRERERERERERDKSGERRERLEKEKKDRNKHREEEKREEGDDDKDKKIRPPVEPLVRDRTVRRVTMPVREWDLGKNEDGFSPPPDGMEFTRHRDDRYERRVEYDKDKRDDYDDRRRRDRDRSRRSLSGEPPRKSKKKAEEEAPAKLLDDLFRKTKATPCIYWLPLTPEQIAVKEEMRRKHMAEHEKKVAELKKMQREQNKRGSDKRRRRSRSRSRSRSAKK